MQLPAQPIDAAWTGAGLPGSVMCWGLPAALAPLVKAVRGIRQSSDATRSNLGSSAISTALASRSFSAFW